MESNTVHKKFLSFDKGLNLNSILVPVLLTALDAYVLLKGVL